MLKSCYVPCHVHARCRRTCSYERNRERAVRIQPLLSARRKYRGWMHHKTHAHSHTSLLAADDVQASGFYPFPVGGRLLPFSRRWTRYACTKAPNHASAHPWTPRSETVSPRTLSSRRSAHCQPANTVAAERAYACMGFLVPRHGPTCPSR